MRYAMTHSLTGSSNMKKKGQKMSTNSYSSDIKLKPQIEAQIDHLVAQVFSWDSYKNKPLESHWQPLLKIFAANINLKLDYLLLQVHNSSHRFGPYVQVKKREGNKLQLEISAHKTPGTLISKEAQKQLIARGWYLNEDTSLTTYLFNVKPEDENGFRLAKFIVRILRDLYEVDQNCWFEFSPRISTLVELQRSTMDQHTTQPFRLTLKQRSKPKYVTVARKNQSSSPEKKAN